MSDKFHLSEKFLDKYQGQEPNWGFGELSKFVYLRTYSRIKEDGSKEDFFDTVRRVVEGEFTIQLRHCQSMGLPWDAHRAQRSAQKTFQKIWEFKFSPPGRGLWMMGAPVVDKLGSACLQNCAFVSTKNIKKDFGEPFGWACDMLMLGVGVGFDTKGADTLVIKSPKGEPVTYTIPDTREGWVESVVLLLDSYRGKNPVQFDYDLLRPAGAPIKGFGGTASGPEPLKDGHESIKQILDDLAGEYITAVAITDIMDFIGKFVVSGNTRRSALISIGDPLDADFIDMKNPQTYQSELLDRRWASNNSVYVTPDSDFSPLTDNIIANGEPGLVFIDASRHYGRLKDGWHPEDSEKFDTCEGKNPCGEISLNDRELCNLVECYPANHDSPEEFYETLKYAYLYAKSVTLLPTHNERTNEVMLQNRRIGLSQSGIQQAIKKFGHATYFKEFCDQAYKEVKRWDYTYSRWLGIPHSIKKTTVKPSGTVSILAGATPGVHCTHSERYLRAIRISAGSEYVPALLRAGYKIEIDLTDWSKLEKAIGEDTKLTQDLQNAIGTKDLDIRKYPDEILSEFAVLGGSLVVYFPVEETNFTKSKYDISLWEQLATVRELQSLWADNSVSCTVTIAPNEEKDLLSAIQFYSSYVKTLSFLPLTDHGYAQAPYTSIDKEEYDTYSKSLKKIRYKKKIDEELVGSKYCDADVCTI